MKPGSRLSFGGLILDGAWGYLDLGNSRFRCSNQHGGATEAQGKFLACDNGFHRGSMVLIWLNCEVEVKYRLVVASAQIRVFQLRHWLLLK